MTCKSDRTSFDHRVIDCTDGTHLMKVFKELCENPLGMLA